MIDLLLMKCNKICWSTKREGLYFPMCTYGDAEVICISSTPKKDFEYVENRIEYMIEHEVIHIVLASIIDHRTSVMYDQVFPNDIDLRVFMYE